MLHAGRATRADNRLRSHGEDTERSLQIVVFLVGDSCFDDGQDVAVPVVFANTVTGTREVCEESGGPASWCDGA